MICDKSCTLVNRVRSPIVQGWGEARTWVRSRWWCLTYSAHSMANQRDNSRWVVGKPPSSDVNIHNLITVLNNLYLIIIQLDQLIYVHASYADHLFLHIPKSALSKFDKKEQYQFNVILCLLNQPNISLKPIQHRACQCHL